MERNFKFGENQIIITYDLSPNNVSAQIIAKNSGGKLTSTLSFNPGGTFNMPNTTLFHTGNIQTALTSFKNALSASGYNYTAVSRLLIIAPGTNDAYIYEK